MLKQIILAAVVMTVNLNACVTYDPKTNTYTIDQYGSVDSVTSESSDTDMYADMQFESLPG